jgi:hypothetical protein
MTTKTYNKFPTMNEADPIPETIFAWKIVGGRDDDDALPYHFDHDRRFAEDEQKVRGGDLVRVMVRPERVEVSEEVCGRLVFCRDFFDVREAIAFAKSRAEELGVPRVIPQNDTTLVQWNDAGTTIIVSA